MLAALRFARHASSPPTAASRAGAITFPAMTTADLPDRDLPAQYDPAAHEPQIYARWEQAGVFTASAAKGAVAPH